MRPGKKKKTVFEDVLTTVTKYFAVLCVVVTLIICLSGIRIINSDQTAIILRFGRLVGDTYEEQVHGAGLLLAFPYIIDEVITVPTGSVMQLSVTTHTTSGTMTSYYRNGYVITGDQNIALISASVKYNITNAVEYALSASSPEQLINAAVSNAMINAAASRAVDDLLTSGKDEYAREVLKLSQSKLNEAGIGVTLAAVELTNVTMPAEIRSTYELVNSSTVQAATLLERARQYRENLIPQAQAEANAGIAAANTAYSAAVAEANADLTEFWGVLDEYNANTEVVRLRLYHDKIAAIISSIGTVRVVDDSDSKIILN